MEEVKHLLRQILSEVKEINSKANGFQNNTEQIKNELNWVGNATFARRLVGAMDTIVRSMRRSK